MGIGRDEEGLHSNGLFAREEEAAEVRRAARRAARLAEAGK